MIKSIEVTLKLPCINGCQYCPQGALKKAYKGRARMTEDTFLELMDTVRDDTAIHFSGFSEPFLHSQCIQFITIACLSGNPVRLFTTLVGATHTDIDALASMPMQEIVVHLPDGEFYKPKSSVSSIAKYAAKKLKHAKFITVYTDNTRSKMWSKRLGVTVKTEEIVSRSGKVCFAEQITTPGAVKCRGNRQYQPVVLPDGDISLCCNDYGLNWRMGNVYEDTMGDLEECVKAYERLMADPKRETICNSCWRAVSI